MSAEVIRYSVLMLVLLCLALRIPAVIHGRNRGIFAVLVLMLIGVGLSINSVYTAVDGWLGGNNYANVIIRFSLYAVFAILGMKMTAAFEAPRARRFITGRVGLGVLTVTGVLTLWAFGISALPETATGLRGYGDQPSVQWYTTLGHLYPAYVAACLVGPAFTCAASRQTPGWARGGAALLGAAFLLVPVYTVLRETGWQMGIWDVGLVFGVVSLTCLGLTLFWVSRVVGERERRQKLLPDR